MTQLTIPSEFTQNSNSMEAFKIASKAGEFLPRLQLFGANSNACKTGVIGIAHYGIVVAKDDIEDCGKEVEAAIINWRPKAMHFDEKQVISVYNTENPLFRTIMDGSEVQDSGMTFGPEFLIWLPNQRRLVQWHLNSKTARRESPKLLKLLGKTATLKSKFIESGKHSWHGPVALMSSIPLTSVPDSDKLAKEVAKFLEAKDTEVESAEETVEERPR